MNTCVWSSFPFPPQQQFYFSGDKKRKILETWWPVETASQRNSGKKQEKHYRKIKWNTKLQTIFLGFYNIYYTIIL